MHPSQQNDIIDLLVRREMSFSMDTTFREIAKHFKEYVNDSTRQERVNWFAEMAKDPAFATGNNFIDYS